MEPVAPNASFANSQPIAPPSRRWLLFIPFVVFVRYARRLFFATFVLLILFAILRVGARQWSMRQGARALAEVTATLDATNPGWRWDDLNAARRPVADDQNSALIVDRVDQLLAKDWDREVGRIEQNLPTLAPNVRPFPTVVAQLRRDLATNAEALKLARTLKDKPWGRRDLPFTPDILRVDVGESDKPRRTANLLSTSVTVAAEDGDAPRVADDLVAMLNAGRSVGDDPLPFSRLTRVGCRWRIARMVEGVLAQTQRVEDVRALRLAEFQKLVAEDLTEPLLVSSLRGERSTFALLSDRLRNGPVEELKHLYLAPDGYSSDLMFSIGWWLYRGHMDADRVYIILWLNRAIEAASKPPAERGAALQALESLPKGDPRRFLANLLLPGVRNEIALHLRESAGSQCTLVGIACERFRLKHNRWPRELAELCPEFLAAVPLDPFDGQPLRCRTLPDGVVVYSVGPKPDPAHAILRRNIARPGLPDDILIGFRLWNPEARRQPPPPEPPAPKDDERP